MRWILQKNKELHIMKIIGKNRVLKRSLSLTFLSVLMGLTLPIISSSVIKATEEVLIPPKQNWSFQGPFGTYKRDQLQRGLQVYREVCSTCHGLNLLSYRSLEALGYTKEQVKALAAEYKVSIIDDEGEKSERRALPSDRFVAPYANEQMARAANNGALPPDLSVIVKARQYGPDYIYALLTGYKPAPSTFKLMEGMYYNEYFPGHQIVMAPPLKEGLVTYQDGTQATVAQMAKDIVTFLSWAGEPELEQRKQIGVIAMLFLAFFTLLMFLVMRKVWRGIK